MRLAQLCANIREEGHFPEHYTSSCAESSASLMRLNFSRDVLLILMSSVVSVRYKLHDHDRRMRFNQEVRTRYLRMIAVAPTSIVADCLISSEELQAVAPFIAPGATISQVRTATVSTTKLISLIVDHRAPQFHRDLLDGFIAYGGGQIVCEPVARTFISLFRGMRREAITDDDVTNMTEAIGMPFERLLGAGVHLE